MQATSVSGKKRKTAEGLQGLGVAEASPAKRQRRGSSSSTGSGADEERSTDANTGKRAAGGPRMRRLAALQAKLLRSRAT